MQAILPSGQKSLSNYLPELKARLRIDHDADDARLVRLIDQSRDFVQAVTCRLLTQEDVVFISDYREFCLDTISIPYAPIAAVSGINILKDDQTLGDSVAFSFGNDQLFFTQGAPSDRLYIQTACGYGSPPSALIEEVLRLAQVMYESPTAPLQASAAVNPYILYNV